MKTLPSTPRLPSLGQSWGKIVLGLALVLSLAGGVLGVWHYRYLLEKQDDLDHVPADAFAFFSVRIADYWNGSGGKHVRQALEKIDPEALAKMERELGLAPSDIERLTLVVPQYETWKEEWYGFVVTKKSLDGNQIAHAFGGSSEERIFGNSTYFLRNQLAYSFMSYRQVLVGTEEGIKKVLTTQATAKGPLQEAVRLARQAKHHIVGGINPPPKVMKAYRDNLPFFSIPARPLLEFLSATVVLDDLQGLEMEARVRFEDSSKAKTAKEVFEMLRVFAKGLLPEAKKMLPPEMPEEASNIMKSASQSLEELKLHVYQDSVHIPFRLKGESNQLGAMIAMLVPMVLNDRASK